MTKNYPLLPVVMPADLAQFELDRIAREEAIAKAEADRASARPKLAALGLDDDEVATILS